MPKALTAFGLLIGILSLLCLSACQSAPAWLGRYDCVELLDGELPLDTPESALLLDRGGYARLELDGEGGTVSYTLEGEALRLYVDGAVLEGTLREGVIRLDTAEGLTLVYVQEDQAAAYREAHTAERERREALQQDWVGDWYGFWRIENAEGALENAWYDCCARIRALPEGGLYLLLWDEDSSALRPLAKLRLSVEEDAAARSTDGWFWFASGRDAGLLFRLEDGVFRAEGRHEDNGERFSYSLTLRRWGERWPEDAELPYYYDDWYLPLIRSGEPMPDRISLS